MTTFKSMPIEASRNMIEATYMLVSTMPRGTPERDKELIAEIWRQACEVAPKPMQSGLTRKQMRAHEVIADFIKDNGLSPTYEEIGNQLGMQKSDVFHMVKSMERRGYIKRLMGRRGIRLLRQPGE